MQIAYSRALEFLSKVEIGSNAQKNSTRFPEIKTQVKLALDFWLFNIHITYTTHYSVLLYLFH